MGEGGYRQINKSLNVCAFEDYLSTQQSVLPKLDDVEQLTPLVLRVLGQNAGKVMRHFLPSTPICSLTLTLLLVHTSGYQHVHHWDWPLETYYRHRPRHPTMGRLDLFHPHHLVHHPIPRFPHPLAR